MSKILSINTSKISISSFQLKLIAIITMTIDHLGVFVFPEKIFLRIIGRLSFILFAFLIANGMDKGKNNLRYLRDLLIATIVTSFFFLFTNKLMNIEAIVPSNIFLTLFVGAFSIFIYKKSSESCKLMVKIVNYTAITLLIIFSTNLLSNLSFELMYGLYGVLLIFNFYFILQLDNILLKNSGYLFLLVSANWLFFGLNSLQVWSILAFVPLFLYHGNKGSYNKINRYFFYFYYPVHLLILAVIGSLIQGV